jgi:hypothetical protein
VQVKLSGGGGKVPTLARSLRGRSRVARTLINGIRLVAQTAREIQAERLLRRNLAQGF